MKENTLVEPLLKIGRGNAKLGRSTLVFSLPAGHSCPFARACKAWAGLDGKIYAGAAMQWQCYAAGEERYKNVRDSRWHNFESLKGLDCATSQKLLSKSLESVKGHWERVRIHASGDFFSHSYFRSWCEVAKEWSHKTFYAYTKALPLWISNIDLVPSNLVLTASYGGTHDRLITEYGLKSAKVVFSRQEAQELGLAIDHDDSNAWSHNRSFALLLHGQQKAGTPAAKALSALRASGEKGYSRK